MNKFEFHEMNFTWLNGAKALVDGGATFGPVPLGLWGQHYPYDENILVPQVMDPLLLEYRGKNILIDTSYDTDAMTEKELRNYGIKQESRLEEDLATLGLEPSDIDLVLMTHLHDDHAGGLTKYVDGEWISRFPEAEIIVNEAEWSAVRTPNRRTGGTYLARNWEPVQNQIITFEERLTVLEDITMIKTGGHSPGHSILSFEQAGETAWHFADLLVSTEHSNPAWVTSFDDYPMDSISVKEEWVWPAITAGEAILFYHDPFYRMVRYHESGKGFVEWLETEEKSPIKMGERQKRAHQRLDK